MSVVGCIFAAWRAGNAVHASAAGVSGRNETQAPEEYICPKTAQIRAKTRG